MIVVNTVASMATVTTNLAAGPDVPPTSAENTSGLHWGASFCPAKLFYKHASWLDHMRIKTCQTPRRRVVSGSGPGAQERTGPLVFQCKI